VKLAYSWRKIKSASGFDRLTGKKAFWIRALSIRVRPAEQGAFAGVQGAKTG